MGAARSTDQGLSIDQVATLTGVAANLLRMWEHRYNWPKPGRLPNGYRVYRPEIVPLIKRLHDLTAREAGGRYLVSEIIRDGVPHWPSIGQPIAETWTRYAQLPSAHTSEAKLFRARVDNAVKLRNTPELMRALHEAAIVLRPHERLVAAWLPAFFGAMEWARSGRPLPRDIGRDLGRIAGAAVFADVLARWQTAEAIG